MTDSENPAAYPPPEMLHPLPLPDGTFHAGTVFLKAAIDHARIEVGDYTYASAKHPIENWAYHLAPYIFPFSPERLVIGKFCQIADGVLFITASANHRYDGFSSFPFAVFDGDAGPHRPSMPAPGKDTIIGNDVWIGQGARILPGARLEDGVIVGAGAVVSGHVPAYSIVSGNPSRVVRMRFDDETIARLVDVAWWDWPIEAILASEAAICGSDIEALERARPV